MQRILESETAVDELLKRVRQSTRDMKRKLENEMDIPDDPESVSYTHLDVYKRQAVFETAHLF